MWNEAFDKVMRRNVVRPYNYILQPLRSVIGGLSLVTFLIFLCNVVWFFNYAVTALFVSGAKQKYVLVQRFSICGFTVLKDGTIKNNISPNLYRLPALVTRAQPTVPLTHRWSGWETSRFDLYTYWSVTQCSVAYLRFYHCEGESFTLFFFWK